MLFTKNKSDTVKKSKTNEQNRPFPQAPAFITGATKNASVLTLTFDKPVTLQGTPKITTDVAGVTPVSAAQPDSQTVEITFSGAITAATEINIPYQDEAIRTQRGGFAYSPTFQLAA